MIATKDLLFFSYLFFVFPNYSFSQDFTDIYAGKVTLTGSSYNNYPPASKSKKVKIEVFHYEDGDIDFSDKLTYYEPIEVAYRIQDIPGNGIRAYESGSFDNDDLYICNWETEYKLENISDTSAEYTETYNVTCEDGSSGLDVYKGELKRYPYDRDIHFYSDTIIEKTRCFSIKKPTNFFWSFDDDGGFLARFKLGLENCNGKKRKTLIDINKYTSEEFSKSGNIKIKEKGRYRFSTLTTGVWAVDQTY